MTEPSTRFLQARCLLFVLILVVACGLKAAAAGEVELKGRKHGLEFTLRLTGLVGWQDGMAAALGRQMQYEAKARNISKGALKIPEAGKRLYVALTRPGTLSYRSTAGRAGVVQMLEPGTELKFSGTLTLLQTNICQLEAAFCNTTTQQVKRALVPAGNCRAMVSTTAMVPITNVWTGRIGLSRTLETTGRLDGSLRTRYDIAMRKVLAFEQAAQPMTNYSPAASGKLFLAHPNLTQQSEAVNAIRQVGSDGNSESVSWLWRCFGKTRKNSPLHVAAMAELCQLLGQGIGSGHAERFLDVARAHATQEAIVTRLYAMDAATLYCTRGQFICTAKGNFFVTPVASGDSRKARETLESLTADRLKDIQTRAKKLLGIPVSGKPRGTRKYIRSAGEKPWTPDDPPPSPDAERR